MAGKWQANGRQRGKAMGENLLKKPDGVITLQKIEKYFKKE